MWAAFLHASCDECKKTCKTHEVKLSRHGQAAWLCLGCAARMVFRAHRIGVRNIICPADVWTAVRALDAEQTPPARSSSDPWLSRDQVERTLRREAEATATRLGHKIGPWGVTMASCERCSEVVYAIPREMWKPSIRGECVVMECQGRPRGMGALLSG